MRSTASWFRDLPLKKTMIFGSVHAASISPRTAGHIPIFLRRSLRAEAIVDGKVKVPQKYVGGARDILAKLKQMIPAQDKSDTMAADKPLFASRNADPGVRFIRKYTEPGRLGHTNTYEIYAAETGAAAREFLLTKKVTKQLYYIVVETPDGNWGIDTDGLYHERLLPWQKDLASAQIDGRALPKMPRGEDLKNAALGHRDNFVHEVMCSACEETWPDALRYQNKTVVRCPKCGLLNLIDTSDFHAIIVGQ